MKRYFSPVIAAAIAAIFMLLSSSCSKKTHNLPYFKDITEQTTVVEAPAVPDLVIQPDDELFISVSSADPAATAHFNLPVVNPARTSELSASMQPKQLTYIVDSKGDIIMPELGKVHVAGLTVEQLQNQLTASISRWVENPQVNVRLLSFDIYVLGEVNRPGRINTTDNTLNILDAISAAGDLTQYGLRDRVIDLRIGRPAHLGIFLSPPRRLHLRNPQPGQGGQRQIRLQQSLQSVENLHYRERRISHRIARHRPYREITHPRGIHLHRKKNETK